ncbi:isocitrate lyase/phosphoenolpyruvate mutase family protein [Chromobacterium sp. IIBBL 290-4]|uniref:isocitrate lyase/PEP mutase family protein n=1 Tax=Chromobacterium sp. IIBBL 290-4 TaxID=2953890 RepID=UPI0020B71992|nr:isocitrate lyase/phosphoenolpyruvate mutase family protein [Chromobacterium sp. IIBBL 290-4]UTH75613.1 isocitrate lyase/phosphoenolpyruvate mutase family protein [Chromobacterium sp. IIBBL 290-4]
MIAPLSRFERFRQLNQQGGLLLPNVWDAASARIFAAQGFEALATTSGGIAYARGFSDGQHMGRAAMLAEVRRLAECVALPLSADIEAGYGPSPEDVALTVTGAIEAGAVGVNLEDNGHGMLPQPLFDIEAQCARLAAARRAADALGLPLWINARVDSYLIGGEGEACFAETLARGNAYLAAGADMVFAPGLADAAEAGRLAARLNGPLNLMALPGVAGAADWFAAGVRRVSLGVGPMLACMGLMQAMAAEAKRGEWVSMSAHFYGFAEAERLLAAEG